MFGLYFRIALLQILLTFSNTNKFNVLMDLHGEINLVSLHGYVDRVLQNIF